MFGLLPWPLRRTARPAEPIPATIADPLFSLLPWPLRSPATLFVPTLGQAVYAGLDQSQRLRGYVAGRINPGEYLPIGDALPSITYAITKEARGRQLSGDDGTATAEVKITAWAEGPDSAERIAAEITRAIARTTGGTLRGHYIIAAGHKSGASYVEPLDDGSDLDRHAADVLARIRYMLP